MLGALFEQEQEEDFSMFVDDGVAPTDTTELKGKKKVKIARFSIKNLKSLTCYT
jgi:hypothetical protein